MYPIVDFHTHFLPKTVINAARARESWHGADLEVNENDLPVVKMGRTTKVLGSSRYLESPEERLARMDTIGVNIQVVSVAPVMYRYGVDKRHGVAAAREVNDELISWTRQWPDRFYAFGTLPLQDVSAAIAEMERIMDEPNFVGISVGTHVAGEDWHSDRLFPVLEAAVELDATVFFHPTGQRVPESARGAFHLVNTIGNPLETTLTVAFLILGGVIDRLPELRLLLAHGGGFVCADAGRVNHAYQVRHDAGISRRMPSDYLTNFYYDCITHSESALRYLIDSVGVERVVLGSDYPADMGLADPVSWLDQADTIDQDERHAILGGNSFQLLPAANRSTARLGD